MTTFVLSCSTSKYQSDSSDTSYEAACAVGGNKVKKTRLKIDISGKYLVLLGLKNAIIYK